MENLGAVQKKRLSCDDSIDEWQMGLLGAIKKPTFAGDSIWQCEQQSEQNIMTSDDGI